MLLAILSLVSLLTITVYFGCQKMVADKREDIVTAWRALDDAYQPIEDMASDLVNNHPDETEGIQEAWQKSVQICIGPDDLVSKNLRQYQQVKSRLLHALDDYFEHATRLERKNEKKKQEHIKSYQQLRRAVKSYNEKVTSYNQQIVRFPLSLFNYSKKPTYPVHD